MNSQGKVAVLIVGAGSIGERHLRCFQATGRVEVAVCEQSADLRKAISEKYQVEAYSDFAEALQTGRYQAAVICTPAHLHIAMARAALEANVAVLIEKPLSVSLEETEGLIQLRDERGLAAGVAYVQRFSPALQQVRPYLQKGPLGKPLHAIVANGQHFPTFRPAYREIYYARHSSGGGAIQDALTHSAQTIEWLLGPTRSLFCDAAHQALEGVEVEDTVNVLARNGDVLVNYSLNQFQAPNESTLWVHCEDGSIKIEFHRQRWGVLRHGDENWSWHDSPVENRDSLFTAQAHAFLDALEGKENDICSLEDGMQTLRFNLAALESARSGTRITP